MKVVLKRAATPYHFELEAGSGHTVVTDAAAAIGGTDQGMRPMELLLSSLASCSAIDMVQILGKQRAELHDLEVEVIGKRREKVLPAVFESIHVHFRLWGDLDHYNAEVIGSSRFETPSVCPANRAIQKVHKIPLHRLGPLKTGTNRLKSAENAPLKAVPL
ncbi:MAG: OsmC family protein [Bacteroidota bacterium]